MATESKLQETEVPLRRGRANVRPKNFREEVWLSVQRYDVVTHVFTPDEAYYVGRALMMHAEECGFDPEAA